MSTPNVAQLANEMIETADMALIAARRSFRSEETHENIRAGAEALNAAAGAFNAYANLMLAEHARRP